MEWTKRKAQCKEWQLFEAGTHIPCPVVTLFGQGIVEGTDSGCNQCGAPNGSLHQPVPVVRAKPEVKYEVYVTNQHPDGEHVWTRCSRARRPQPPWWRTPCSWTS
jgi:hypothetical protein